MTAHAPAPTRRLTFRLDRTNAPALAVSVDVPATPTTFAGLMPAVRAVADALQGEAHRTVSDMGRPVTCGRGCDACCRHLVMLGEAEALSLLHTLGTLSEDRQELVRQRFKAGLAALEAAGLMPALYAAFTRQASDRSALAEMQTAYWELGIPCPFLEDSACGIYAGRPLVCRQYAMTSPPPNCRTPFSAQTALVKVLPSVDLAGAAAAFDGEFAQQTRLLPLLFCLLRETHLTLRPFPVLEPERMLTRFLDFATTYYPRQDPPHINKEGA